MATEQVGVDQVHDSVNFSMGHYDELAGLAAVVTPLVKEPIPDHEIDHREHLVGVGVLPVELQHLAPAVL